MGRFNPGTAQQTPTIHIGDDPDDEDDDDDDQQNPLYRRPQIPLAITDGRPGSSTDGLPRASRDGATQTQQIVIPQRSLPPEVMAQILAFVPAQGHQRRDLQRFLANLPDIIGRINELANYIHAALPRRAPAGGQIVVYLGSHSLQLSGRMLDIILARPAQIAGVLLLAFVYWKLRQMGLLDLATWIIKMLINLLFRRPELAIWYAVFDRLQSMLPSNQDALFEFVDGFVGDGGEAAPAVELVADDDDDDERADPDAEHMPAAAPGPFHWHGAAPAPLPMPAAREEFLRARPRRGRSRTPEIGVAPRRRMRTPPRHREAREAREAHRAELERLDAARPGRNPHIDGRGFATKPKAKGRAKAKAKSEQITIGQPATLPYVDYKNDSFLIKPKTTAPVV